MENRKLENEAPLLKQPDPDDLRRKSSDRGALSQFGDLARETGSRVCSTNFLHSRLPCLSWSRSYSWEKLTGDIIAGVTTALTVIPQGIGYAPLAGLPLQYGLYASIVPGFMYCLLGTVKQATVGPTAVNSLMSFNYAGGEPYKAVTLAFFSGLIEILAGVFNLGFLIQYISSPVIKAFSSAVSIQVITSQVKGFLGLSFPGRGFIQVWRGVFENITSTKPYDTGVGLCCMILLYFLRRLKEFGWCEGDRPATSRARVVKKTKWLLSISANCLVVVLTSVLAWVLVSQGIEVLDLTGEVDSGLPAWQLPWQFNRNMSVPVSTTDFMNMTSPEPSGPLDIAGELGLGLVMLPLVSLLQHLAIAKHYSGNRAMAASQEMIALGFCQFIGSFTGSMAVTASFGRSAVNATSGVRTPLGGVITGLIIILACAFLSPYLAFIPTSALSAVIIFSMFYTIDYGIARMLWRSNKVELLPYSLTFLLGLFLSVESGLIVGCLAHLALLLHATTSQSSHLLVERENSHTLIRPKSSLFFPVVDQMRAQLVSVLEAGDSGLPLVLDLSMVGDLDFSAAKGLITFLEDQQKKGVVFLLCGASESVGRVLQGLQGEGLVQHRGVEDALASCVGRDTSDSQLQG